MKLKNLVIVKALAFFLVIGCTSIQLAAQNISRNNEGEVIVTYKDGSWRYFMGSDSILLVNEFRAFVNEERQPMLTEPPNMDQNENEEVFADTMEWDEDLLSETIAEERIVFTENEAKILALTERRLTLTERLRRVESGYLQLSEKELKKVREELISVNYELLGLNEEQKELTTESEPSASVSELYDRNKYMFKIGEKENHAECHVIIERDNFTNKKLARLERAYLFQYTPEEMRPHLKGGHYLDAYSSMSRTNGSTILNIQVDIFSRGAKSGYGSLDKGSRMKIKFISGDVLSLFNTRADLGKKDVLENEYSYTGRYNLDKDAMKLLMKHDIDSIRITWSAGYEDYDVYHVDLIKKQLICLNQAF